VTEKGDFPEELQHLIDELAEDGFDVAYGETDPHDTPGFIAELGETTVIVTDRLRAWFVTVETSEGRVDESWERPARVRREVEELLGAAD